MTAFRSKVFVKIFLSYMIILVLPVMIVGGVSYYTTKQIVDGQLSQVNRMSIEKVREAFDRVFKDMEKTTYLIGRNPWLRNILLSGSIEDLNHVDAVEYSYVISQLKTYRANNNLIKAVSVVSRNGNIAIDADSMYEGDYFFTTRYTFESADFRGFADIDWQNMRPKVIIDAKVTPYSMPGDVSTLYIRNIPTDGHFTGVVIIQIDRGRLLEVLDQFNTDEKTRLMILNEKDELFLTNIDSGDSLLEHMPAGRMPEDGALTTGSGSYRYFGTNSAYNRYRYIAVVDTQRLMVQVNQIRNTTFALAVASMLLGGAVAYFAAVNHYKPIRNLADKLSFGPYRKGKEKRINEISLIEQAFYHYHLEKETLVKDIEAHLPIVRNNTLIKLVRGFHFKGGMEEELKQNGIIFQHPYYLVAIMHVEAAELAESPESDDHAPLSAFIRKNIEECFQTAGLCCYSVEMNNFEYTMIINTDTESYDILHTVLEQIIHNVKAFLAEWIDIVIAVGVGTLQQSLFDIANSGMEARKAMPYKFAALNSEILYYQHIEHHTGHTFEYSLETELQLINVIKTGDISKINDYLDKILERNFQTKKTSANSARYVFHELVSAAVKVMVEYRSDNLDLVDYGELDEKIGNYHEAVGYIRKLYGQVCDMVNSSKINEGIVADIVDFVDRNYHNSRMSLTLLSDNFNISGVYISKLFKKHTGLNFIDYLHKKRIMQAKALLTDPRLLVKDIAGMVGYDNDRNFHRVFKKIEAISPSDYRDTRRS